MNIPGAFGSGFGRSCLGKEGAGMLKEFVVLRRILLLRKYMVFYDYIYVLKIRIISISLILNICVSTEPSHLRTVFFTYP